MNGLFGLELPTSVNFVIAFVVVLALIGAATWLVRRFGAPRLDAGARNRQPRLAVIDSAAVDGRRKLVIIRRDNVEHLLMVGGPTDVVVETNIVRAGAARRPRSARRARQRRRDAAARHAAARHDAIGRCSPSPRSLPRRRSERAQDAAQQPAPAPAPAARAPRERAGRRAGRRAADQAAPAALPVRARAAGGRARPGSAPRKGRAGGADRPAGRRRQRPEPRQHGASA